MDESTKLLGELMRFLNRTERCAECCGPSSAFEGKHLVEYTRLRQRIMQRLASFANLPN